MVRLPGLPESVRKSLAVDLALAAAVVTAPVLPWYWLGTELFFAAAWLGTMMGILLLDYIIRLGSKVSTKSFPKLLQWPVRELLTVVALVCGLVVLVFGGGIGGGAIGFWLAIRSTPLALRLVVALLSGIVVLPWHVIKYSLPELRQQALANNQSNQESC